MDWLPTDVLWRTAIAVIPLAVLIAVVCRLVPCRPSTRHALWLVVLTLLVAAPLVGRAPISSLSAVIEAAPGFPIVRPPVSEAPSRDPVATQAAPRKDGVDAIAAPPPSIARVTPRPHTPVRVPPPEVGIFQLAVSPPRPAPLRCRRRWLSPRPGRRSMPGRPRPPVLPGPAARRPQSAPHLTCRRCRRSARPRTSPRRTPAATGADGPRWGFQSATP